MPKNIVLLSDGTGNSAAKLFKTNVWRVFDALDLSEPQRQVAYYDDGVGTSGFAPLRIVGGVAGVGLKRNVLRLYRFLCEQYEPGDRIYAFGFSRGAFTIRVLLALIADQGVILSARGAGGSEGVHGAELQRLVRHAYRAFRRRFNQTGVLVTLARGLRDTALSAFDRVRGRRGLHDVGRHHPASIEFVGLWDTVDAYGLPIDELTQGVDQWVWPLSMPDLTPLPFIRKACHALSIDDERNTFHPVLWDEAGEADLAALQGRPWPPTHIDEERISQVWFAGVHANVGGGYANDSLAQVSLAWIVDAADTRGLHVVPARLEQALAPRNPLGQLDDSRSGLKGYYRYNPRRIEWLTNGQVHEQGFRVPRRVDGLWRRVQWPTIRTPVVVARPKIHHTVIDRLLAAPECYAPAVLPPEYDVVTSTGQIVPASAHQWPPQAANERRIAAQERVWDLIWWRRVVYFSAVAATIWLVVQPFLAADAETAPTSPERPVLGRLVERAGGWLPDLASPWIAYFRARPDVLVAGLALIVGLALIGRWLKGRIAMRMHAVWTDALDPLIASDTQATVPSPSGLTRLRLHRWYQGSFAVLRRHVLPALAGSTLLWCLLALVNRTAFEAANGLGWLCTPPPTGTAATPIAPGASVERAFGSDEFCAATGMVLEAGGVYRIEFPGPRTPWTDCRIDMPLPAGRSSVDPTLAPGQRVAFVAGVPFRRLWFARWFVPVARIGTTGFDQYALSASGQRLVARTSGHLHLFVNDAIAPVLPDVACRRLGLGWRTAAYGNNHGAAIVRVTREQ